MSVYKKILVAVDISPEATQVMEKARSIADLHGAALDVVHVVEPVVIETGNDITPTIDTELEDNLVTRSKSFISGVIAQLGMSIDDLIVPVGSTKGEIHEVARKQGTDLIIIGTHGRHGVALLLGSTANAVLHGAPCDVLSVKIRAEK